MPAKSYADQQQLKYTVKTREILNQLPGYCKDYLRSIENNTEAYTRLGYVGDLERFFTFLHSSNPVLSRKEMSAISLDDLSCISRTDIEEFLEMLKGGPDSFSEKNEKVTIARKISSLRGFFTYLSDNDMIPGNPMEKIKAAKFPEKDIVYLNPNEVDKFLATVKNGRGKTKREDAYHKVVAVRDYAITMLMLGTGVRVSELVGINISDIDFEESEIRIHRKGGRDTSVFFGIEVKEAMLAYYKQRKGIIPADGDEDAFFLSTRKTRLGVRAVEKLVEKYATAAAPLKNISPHRLRSTFASNLLRETGNIALVGDCLGHKSIDTTRRRYANLEKDTKRQIRDIPLYVKE